MSGFMNWTLECTQKLHFKEKEKRYNLNMQKDRSKSYEEKNNFNINNTVG